MLLRLCIFVLCAFPVFVSAQTATWSLVVNGRDVYSVAASPAKQSILYAGLAARYILKSTDAGITWSELTIGSGGGLSLISTMVPHPTDTNIVLAGGSFFDGLARTTDGGNTWNTVLQDPDFGRFTVLSSSSVAFHPTNPDTVFAVKEIQSVVYRSVDAGANWDSLSKPPGLVNTDALRALTIAPDSSHIMLLSGRRSIIFRSTDAGNSWDGSVQLPGLQPDTDVSCFRWSPSQPGTVYAAVQTSIAANTGNGGVFKSTDYGVTWARIKAVDTSLYAMEIYPTKNGDEMYVGGNVIALATGAVQGRGIVLRSADGLQTWQDMSDVPWAPLEDGSMIKNIWGFARSVSADGIPYVYMATESGMYRTELVTSIRNVIQHNPVNIRFHHSTIEVVDPVLQNAVITVYSTVGELLFTSTLTNGNCTLPSHLQGILAIQLTEGLSTHTTLLSCIH